MIYLEKSRARLAWLPSGGPTPVFNNVAARIAVLLIALAILFLRTPSTFTNPQFWAEEADFFFAVHTDGWSSLIKPMAGYLVFVQLLVAKIAAYFSPVAAPIIDNYAAIFLTLLVVWIVTSPRLDLPAKPLLAIAVVIVPMGYEELGTLTNIQWILPVGAFALLFMQGNYSRSVLAGEAIFLGVTALSGPFSLFLTPLFFWQFIAVHSPMERRRLKVLTLVVGLGALTQLLIVAANYTTALNSVAPIPYSRALWITLPLAKIMTTFGPATLLFQGRSGAFLGLICIAVAVALAAMRPYRTQKIFMFIFAALIAVGGMYKFRYALGGQVDAQRYFYVASIFSLWFICCLSVAPYWRVALPVFVAVVELALLPSIAGTPRIDHDLQWPVWARYMSSGLPLTIPTSPRNWYLGVPAANAGPLSRYSSWIGRDVRQLTDISNSSFCGGFLGGVDAVEVANSLSVPNKKNLWSARGWVDTDNHPILIALTDSTETVLGFGLLGFEKEQAGPRSPPEKSEWRSLFNANPGTKIHAYAIFADGRNGCRLKGEQYFPTQVKPLFQQSDFLTAIEIVPNHKIVQRFKPSQRWSGIRVIFVDYGRQATSYPVAWRIVASSQGSQLELGSGTIDASTIGNWEIVELPLTILPNELSEEVELSLWTDTTVTPPLPIGLPLYRPMDGPAAEVDRAPVVSGGQIGIELSYVE